MPPLRNISLILSIVLFFELSYGMKKNNKEAGDGKPKKGRPTKAEMNKAERVFWLSSSKPMSRALSKYPAVLSSTQTIISHIERVESAIRRNFEKGDTRLIDTRLNLCHAFQEANMFVNYQRRVRNKFESRSLPEADTSCISQLSGVKVSDDDNSPITTEGLFNALQMRGDTVFNNIDAIQQQVIGNFSNPDFVYAFTYRTVTQTCILHSVGAIRVDEKWYTNTQITNLPRHHSPRLFSRQYITEFIRTENGVLTDPLRVSIPVRNEDGEERIVRDDTTTYITSVRGEGNPAFVGRLYPAENPAVLEALDSAGFYVQQAKDALAPSNAAILVLPLGLNLVPIALLADVDTITMLFYALLSDILTVIPLFIKGVELILISRQRHFSATTRITSPVNASASRSAVSEVWTAECRAKDDFLRPGVLFVVLAMVFMVGGIAAEVVARRYWRRHQFNATDMIRQTTKVVGLSPALSRISSVTTATNSFADVEEFFGAHHGDMDSMDYEMVCARARRKKYETV